MLGWDLEPGDFFLRMYLYIAWPSCYAIGILAGSSGRIKPVRSIADNKSRTVGGFTLRSGSDVHYVSFQNCSPGREDSITLD